MSVKIRLARFGAKKRPYYHIVVANSRAPRDGSFIEQIGIYNPMVERTSPEAVKLDAERVKYWLSKGAQPTDRVARFIGEAGLGAKFVPAAQSKKPLPKAKAQERLKAAADAKAAKEAEAATASEAEAKAFEEPAAEPAMESSSAEIAPEAAAS